MENGISGCNFFQRKQWICGHLSHEIGGNTFYMKCVDFPFGCKGRQILCYWLGVGTNDGDFLIGTASLMEG